MPSQVKLLRLLQDGTYYPLGADRAKQSRARIVVAPNCNVAEAVSAGTFRKDLYYRLRTHHLQLPPLRRRQGDLPLLVDHFVQQASRVVNKPVASIPDALYSWLTAYRFPGNIRELEAMVFDAVARHHGAVLSLQSFKEVLGSQPPVPADAVGTSVSLLESTSSDRMPTLAEAEDGLVKEALERSCGNQGIAAGLLGIARQALNKRFSRRK